MSTHTVEPHAVLQGRVSGTLQIYSLPKLSIENKQSLECRPEHLALNSDST